MIESVMYVCLCLLVFVAVLLLFQELGQIKTAIKDKKFTLTIVNKKSEAKSKTDVEKNRELYSRFCYLCGKTEKMSSSCKVFIYTDEKNDKHGLICMDCSKFLKETRDAIFKDTITLPKEETRDEG